MKMYKLAWTIGGCLWEDGEPATVEEFFADPLVRDKRIAELQRAASVLKLNVSTRQFTITVTVEVPFTGTANARYVKDDEPSAVKKGDDF